MSEVCAFCGSDLDGHPGELHDVVMEGSIFLDNRDVGITAEKGDYCDFRCFYGRLMELLNSAVYIVSE